MSGGTTIPEGAREHRTSDLYLAAALICAGFPLDGTDRVSENKVEFKFLDTLGTFQRVRGDFFNGSLTVGAKAFTSEIKNLKSLVHSV